MQAKYENVPGALCENDQGDTAGNPAGAMATDGHGHGDARTNNKGAGFTGAGDGTGTGQAGTRPMPYTENTMERWRDSKSVVKLHEFSTKHKDHGFYLCVWDGRPTMHFEPALDHKQKKRWKLAINALNLLMDAK